MTLRERIRRQQRALGHPWCVVAALPDSERHGLPAHLESVDCWCDPDVEEHEDAYLIIHRTGAA